MRSRHGREAADGIMAAVTRLPVALVAATMVVSGCGAGRAGPIPADTLAQIRAEYGPRAYVPGFVPRGFIFTSWRIDPAQYEYLAPVLQITFGESGKLLRWTVFDKQDSHDPTVFTGGDCTKHPYASSSRRIDDKLVYYASGNHGDSAWTCSMVSVVAGLLNENVPGRPSAQTAMQMVASATR